MTQYPVQQYWACIAVQDVPFCMQLALVAQVPV
jgi:hypothetical protein